ncbi:hypothetical protein [Microscilla marina]|uniref:STAS/SEC14 domain-containing protein n=1 Tax=Microscilla marina ATCC 23134 TaxID=313606 RepID=A1ZVL3_MICM2|nr:hypothetical protein [Microscilla marina]EAY25556.1 hypothetical protein M23134_00654 [Microscilla marina ATCC 23134]
METHKIVTKKGMIYYEESLNALVALWNDRFMLQGEYRETMEQVLELMKSTGASSFITDVRTSKVLSRDQQEYQINEMFPKFIRAGLKRSAYVVPKDVFVQSAIGRAEQELRKYVDVQKFKDLESAKDWVREESIRETQEANNKPEGTDTE